LTDGFFSDSQSHKKECREAFPDKDQNGKEKGQPDNQERPKNEERLLKSERGEMKNSDNLQGEQDEEKDGGCEGQ